MKTYRRSFTRKITGLLVLLPIAIPIGLYRRSAAQEERNAELMQALSTGQVAEARALLAQGADPNTRDLPTAPARGLLQHIVDLFTPPPPPAIIQERTALSCACTNRNAAALVKLLLEKGADVSAQDQSRKTAMVLAAGNGQAQAVKALLQWGVDADTRYQNDLTALMWAAGNGDVATAKVLLDAKADLNLKDNRGKTALAVAREFQHKKIVTLLEAADGLE